MCAGHEIDVKSLKTRMEEMMRSAETGDIMGLYSSISNDPQVLQDMDNIQFLHTPLHEAAARGHTTFAVEIMNLMPSLGKKLNPQGLTPLHLALERNRKDTAKALVRADQQLVRVKGKEGLTPLLLAARIVTGTGDLDVLVSLLSHCPDSIYDLNNRFQTAVHVALEYGNCNAFTLLLNWVVRKAREHTLAWKDERQNTLLHLAVQHDGALEGVKKLVKITKVSKKNSDGKTPLDIAQELGSEKMKKVLMEAGAQTAADLPKKQTLTQYLHSPVTRYEDLLRREYFMHKELTVDMRSVILVVAVLIATATYQVVLQPPGGVYQGQADSPTDVRRRSLERSSPRQVHQVGRMVMSSPLFMPANTVAFITSLLIIIFMLPGRPYTVVLQTCLIFLAYSYLKAMDYISNSSGVSKFMFFFSWFAIVTAFVGKMVYSMGKAIFKDVWWLPRCAATSSNVYNRFHGRGAVKIVSLVRILRRQYKLIQH
ncbi:ankyrin repeat-containing protein BDA1-like [Sesamum indicum]|uniref:Ankyrin repeat-containing protein BDA1-like n=1 Tax=Sesamum indicum TaxID=4182 RepID=A0A6I9TJW8_SESIN|nr:ankyrin repeat-containing protein BDA1-like [Sesamum indicum]